MLRFRRAATQSILVPLLVLSSSGFAADGETAPGSVRSKSPNHPSSGWGSPVIGRLSNGLRFAIMPRKGNEPGVAVLMRNEGGFIAEHRPGERGLAHLIEHIAFHSPTLGSPDDYDHLKRIGMPVTLPAMSAGSTSWRETNYYLSTKSTNPSDIDLLLSLFREAATGMTLRADAVDASRSEVIREMSDKKPGNEIYANYIAAVAPGSSNDALDAQNSDDVPTASISTIRSLYQRLYRPETMMIVVVGNVKVDQVKGLIQKRFGDWTSPRPAPVQAPFPMVQRERIRPISISTLPQGRRTALMTVVMPTPAPPPSGDRQARTDLMDLLVTRAVGDRLAATQPAGPPEKTGMLIENGEQGHRQIMLWDNFALDQWGPAVAVLRKTTCDLAHSGFTAKQWGAAKQKLVADLEHRVAEMPKAANVDLAKDLSHALADSRYPMPPDELLRYARSMLPQLDAVSGSIWWRRQWDSGVEHLRVEAPELARLTDPVSALRRAANGASTAPSCKLR